MSTRRRRRSLPSRFGVGARGAALCVLATAACLAAPPPIVVATPYGDVRAESQEKALEVAGILRDLAPRVQEILPGSQNRPIDVWVQEELRVWRHQRRPESVRGFTLLADEFKARRIHLLDDDQSPWYLSHELVHALIGPSWKALPGVLEEGLGDVVAERLNPEMADRIRAHRLLNTATISGGFELGFSFSVPEEDRPASEWQRTFTRLMIRPAENLEGVDLRALLSTSRSDLHQRYPEIPESFYGLAWLMTSRIVERRGLEGLHDLCQSASARGLELVPVDWLAEAAEMDLDHLDPAFLGSCFGRREMIAAAWLQSEAFAGLTLDVLRPLQPSYRRLKGMNPSFHLADGTDVSLRSLRPLSYGVYAAWRDESRAITAAAPATDSGTAVPSLAR